MAPIKKNVIIFPNKTTAPIIIDDSSTDKLDPASSKIEVAYVRME